MLSTVCLKERCSYSVVIKGFIFFIISLYIDLGTWACYKCFLGKYYKPLSIKFVYIFLSFKMKCYSSSRKSVSMLDVNLVRRDFIFLLMVTEFRGFELSVVILSTIRTKSAVSCAAEALQLTDLFFLSLGFNPCKAEQPLQGMELQEKKHKKDYRVQKICFERNYS